MAEQQIDINIRLERLERTNKVYRLLLGSVFLIGSLIMVSGQSAGPSAGRKQSVEEIKAELVQRIEQVRSSLQQQIDTLKAKSEPAQPQTHPAPKHKEPVPAADAKRVKVIGETRRSVYDGPNSHIIGKVEPGSVLRVNRVIEQHPGGLWFSCALESGKMKPLGETVGAVGSGALTDGWLPLFEVEVIE